MYFRTYFTKDNTIVYKSEFNFGTMPTIDLFYGGGVNKPNFSRYIFQFPMEGLEQKYQKCQLGDLTNVKHKLKFKHAGFNETAYACMPSSYSVCLFKIDEPWEEGCGTDTSCAELCTSFARLNCNVSKSPSNWYLAQSGDTWATEGVFNSLTQTPQYLMCKTISCGSPDLEFDVTDIVNDMILTGGTNQGFGLAFHYNLERETSDIENHVVFFGKETETFFEPFLETEYLNPIIDDRARFYLDKTNRLYLYPKVDGEMVNLDQNPVVEIYNESNQLQYTLTGTCQDLGVYYIEFDIPSASVQRCLAWTDKWKNISINGKSLPDQSFKFNILPAEDYYDFSYNTPVAETNYNFGFRGVKRDEIIHQGDIRKIFVDMKSPSNPHKQITVDNIFYRIYIKQGPFDELTIIDWMPVNRGVCENWFLLDTSWMIPQTYVIDFKVLDKETIKTYPEKIKINIITKPIFH